MAKGKSITKTAVWILLGLLILGLGGFGATNLSGQIRSIGTVGSKSLPVEIYARQLQQEIRAVEAQTGQPMNFAQAQEIGLDRAVLQRFVRSRALDHEAAELGLSIGDASLRDQILEIPNFKGVDGSFDREGYSFALQQAGVSETQFENQLREETARTLLQAAVISGVEMPQTFVDTLLAYVGEERSFTWTLLGEADLTEPLTEPADADLRAWHADNIDTFTLPETKRITYAALSPADLIDAVELDEEELRQAYAARDAEFNQPERRLVERLAYLDQAAVDAAAAALAAGSSFELLVAERGLTLADVDLGDVSAPELGAAANAVFEAAVGDVVGPLPTDLGPALFRVNGILAAEVITFEEALPILRDELANDRALRLVDAQVQNFDDLLAGGATLEDLAKETDMVLGEIDWTADSSDGVAAYEAFRQMAESVTADDYPVIERLDDGGLFALRLNEVLPPRPSAYEDVAEEVAEHRRTNQTETALLAQAEALLPLLQDGSDFTELDLDAVREIDLTRSGFVDGTPPDFLEQVFAMTPGEVRVLDNAGSVVVVRLDNVTPPGSDSQARALAQQLREQINQSLAQNIFDLYVTDVTTRAVPQVNPQAVQAVHVNFP